MPFLFDMDYSGLGLRFLRATICTSATAALILALSLPVWAQQPPAAPPGGGAAQPAEVPAGQATPVAPAGQAAPAKAEAETAKVYLNEPLPEAVETDQKRQRITISRILRAGKFESGQQQVFDTYYNTYSLARWKDQKNAHLLTDFRRETTNELRSSRTGAVHDHLSNAAMTFCTDLIKRNYHPAVRVNAMMMIGDLNAVDTTSTTDFPKPLPEALPLLLEALGDPKQLDAVKVVALRALIRHAALGIADADVRDRQVLPTMLKLATTKADPGRSPDGHAWMRSMAIEALGRLNQLGQDAEVPKALMEIVTDDETPLFTRRMAARTLGKLTYGLETGLDPMQLVAALGQLSTDACNEEIDNAEKEKAKAAAEDDEKEDLPIGAVQQPNLPTAEEIAEKERAALRLRTRIKTSLQATWVGLVGESDAVNYTRWKPNTIRFDEFTGVADLATAEHQQKHIENVLAELRMLLTIMDGIEMGTATGLLGVAGQTQAFPEEILILVKLSLEPLTAALENPPKEGGQEPPADAPTP